MPAVLPPFLFRIIGTSTDGMVVTLGRYRSRPDAETDYNRFVKERYYRNLKICELDPPPPPPEVAPAPAKKS